MPNRTLMIIPAAGLGTRLKTSTPKILVRVNGNAMVDWLLDLHSPIVSRFVLVLHPSSGAAVREHCRSRSAVDYAYQDKPTGMLDGILAPFERVRRANADRIWITWCDQVAIHPDTARHLEQLSSERHAPALIFPTARRSAPYVHIVRDVQGRITDIRHRREGDEMPQVGESDVGLFSLSPEAYLERLPEFASRLERATTTNERNFLPFIPWLSQHGATVQTFPCRDEQEAIGINTEEDLRLVERYLAGRG